MRSLRHAAILLALCLGVAAIASGCATLDEATGTTVAQRCANYRALVAALQADPALETDAGLQRRLIYYEVFIAANCPPVEVAEA